MIVSFSTNSDCCSGRLVEIIRFVTDLQFDGLRTSLGGLTAPSSCGSIDGIENSPGKVFEGEERSSSLSNSEMEEIEDTELLDEREAEEKRLKSDSVETTESMDVR